MRLNVCAALAALFFVGSASAQVAKIPNLRSKDATLYYDAVRQEVILTGVFEGRRAVWHYHNGAYGVLTRHIGGIEPPCPRLHQYVRLTRSRLIWGATGTPRALGPYSISRACLERDGVCKAKTPY
jgi:hypothetical protein